MSMNTSPFFWPDVYIDYQFYKGGTSVNFLNPKSNTEFDLTLMKVAEINQLQNRTIAKFMVYFIKKLQFFSRSTNGIP